MDLGKGFFRLMGSLEFGWVCSGATDIEPEMEINVHRKRRSPGKYILPGEGWHQDVFSGHIANIDSPGDMTILFRIDAGIALREIMNDTGI